MPDTFHSLLSGIELHEAKRYKAPVRAASTVNVTLSTPGSTIDGVALATGDRILLKDQTLSAQNGIYIWTASATALARSTDADDGVDFLAGDLVYVQEGTINATAHWTLTTTGTVIPDTTPLTYLGISGTGPAGATGPAGPMGPSGNFTVSGVAPYACIMDQKPQNTTSGTFTNGADRTRDLNTITANSSGIVVSLASNQFTLNAGTYRIRAEAPAFNVNRHQALLFNITANAEVKRGTSEVTAGSAATTWSRIIGTFSVGSTSVFEIRHRCNTTVSTVGFGQEANFGVETYTVVELWLEGAAQPFFPNTQNIFPNPSFDVLRRRYLVAGTMDYQRDDMLALGIPV